MAADKSKSFVMALRLKELRTKKGLSHEVLRKALIDKYEIDISVDSLKNYEVAKIPHAKAYKNEGMRVAYLRCLADFYAVSTDYLLGRTDEPSPKPAAVDDLGLSPGVVDWLRKFRQSSEPDEEGYIHRAGLIQNLNILLENVNFRALVEALCNLIDGIEAENVFYSLPYSPDLSKEIREIEASGQYNDTVLDLLRTQNALHDNSSDIQLPGRLVFGVEVTDILSNDVTRSITLLVDSLRKRRE